MAEENTKRSKAENQESHIMGSSTEGPQDDVELPLHETFVDETFNKTMSIDANAILALVRQHLDAEWQAEVQPFAIPCLPEQLEGLFPPVRKGVPFDAFSEGIEPGYMLTRQKGNLPPSTGPWKRHVPAFKLAVLAFNVIDDLIQSARNEFHAEIALEVASVPVANAIYYFNVIVLDECILSVETLRHYVKARALSYHLDIPFAYEHNDELRIAFGRRCMQASRVQGTKDSSMWRMHGQPKLDSDNRLQIASLSIVVKSGLNSPSIQHAVYSLHTPILAGEVSTERTYMAMQNMGLFLRASLRLNREDITSVVHMIHRKAAWRDWPRRIYGNPAQDEIVPGVLKAKASRMAVRALKSAVAICKEGHGAKLLEGFQDFDALEQLSVVWKRASEADAHMKQHWLVYTHMRMVDARRRIRTLKPSFFHNFGPKTQCDSHVHIMDWNINGLQEFLILTFNGKSKPTSDEIKAANTSLCNRFAAREDRLVVTEPLFYDQRCPDPVFRVDGMANFCFVRSQVGPRIRAVLGSKYQTSTSDMVLPPQSGTRNVERSDPALIIVWMRHSVREKAVDIVAQLWNVIREMPDALLPLRDEDMFVVVAEQCSSTRHGWHERHMVKDIVRLMQQNPSHKPFILTASADRLTRQVNDLDQIYDLLSESQAAWFFRQRVTDGSGSGYQWFDSEMIEAKLRQDLAYAMDFGLHSGTYSKNRILLTRLANADRFHVVFMKMKALLDYVFTLKGIKRIVIYVRASPNYDSAAQDANNPGEYKAGVEIQAEILSRFVPDRFNEHAGNLATVRDVFVSAFSSTREQRLMDGVHEDERRTCVLSTSMDRVTRRNDGLAAFRKEMSESGGHCGLCFLWDYETTLNIADGLSLTKGAGQQQPLLEWQKCADEMKKFTPSVHHLAFLQPIFWCVPVGDDQCPELESHIIRHVNNAENYCLAIKAVTGNHERTSLGLALPDALAQGDLGHMLSPKRLERWKDFLKTFFQVQDSQITFQMRWSANSFTCKCAEDQVCRGSGCVCNCTFCRSTQLCTCDPMASCQCDEICSCACDHCHDKRGVVKPQLQDHDGSASTGSNLRRRVTSCDQCIGFRLNCSETDPCNYCKLYKRTCSWKAKQDDIALRGPVRAKQRCVIMGCTNLGLSAHSPRCKEHEHQRKTARAAVTLCARSDCDARRLVGFVYCSLKCYLQDTPNPRRCGVFNCDAVAPVGLGLKCLRHGGFPHPDDRDALNQEFYEIDRVLGWPKWT